MATYKLQIPADAVFLNALVNRLGFDCGALKAVSIKDVDIDNDPAIYIADVKGKKIDLWFSKDGEHHVNRITATLVEGVTETCNGAKRRVYLEVAVEKDGWWRAIKAQEYQLAGLEIPEMYDGLSYIAVFADGSWACDTVVNAAATFPYHRFNIVERAEAVARAKSYAARLRVDSD